jgi:ferredoxin
MKITVADKIIEVGGNGSLVELLKNNSIKIKNNCEGNCACGRCLVEFEKNVYNLLKVENEELDLLDRQTERTKYTRLSCQVKIEDLTKLGFENIKLKIL